MKGSGFCLKQLVGLAWNSWVERCGVFDFCCDIVGEIFMFGVRVGVHFRAWRCANYVMT